ncbi:acetyl-CoA C-acyltransferase [Phycicoccus sp. BSK3Z-2]|uniref:Probable acetyl-CoA acetyltransferase n=1 Tax=Phycicoccus avicenniae TaxID=2828860 RepID=A0A941DAQ6_9MICO|nr:acetyl-CoA C-acyltransferase [Phycicoccus avicenniae]MBR7744820.1 acetyl-CoA C-acyltransferase [Phycicoccus avicenniae]
MRAATDEDVVLLGGARTAVGRMGGRLADVGATALGARAVRAALTRLGDPEVDSVVLGTVVQGGTGQNPARIAATAGGVPRTVPGITLNDVCLASMSAVAYGAHQLRAGEARRVLVGGFESMSRAQRSPVDLLVRDGLWCALEDVGMGELSDAENRRLGIDRPAQDEVALASHERAAAATDSGRLGEEILDGSGGEADEGIRRGTSATALAGLAPVFGEDGTITAGNASQMSDAAAVGVLGTAGRSRADGHTPLARVVGSAVVAGRTSSLHERPAEAARLLLEREGLTPGDVDVWEVNEAFAGVVVATERSLGVEHDRVNVNGGAIALGHPLGASGFRLVLTLAHELRARGGGLGVATICGGGGQGRAVLLEGT